MSSLLAFCMPFVHLIVVLYFFLSVEQFQDFRVEFRSIVLRVELRSIVLRVEFRSIFREIVFRPIEPVQSKATEIKKF